MKRGWKQRAYSSLLLKKDEEKLQSIPQWKEDGNRMVVGDETGNIDVLVTINTSMKRGWKLFHSLTSMSLGSGNMLQSIPQWKEDGNLISDTKTQHFHIVLQSIPQWKEDGNTQNIPSKLFLNPQRCYNQYLNEKRMETLWTPGSLCVSGSSPVTINTSMKRGWKPSFLLLNINPIQNLVLQSIPQWKEDGNPARLLSASPLSSSTCYNQYLNEKRMETSHLRRQRRSR